MSGTPDGTKPRGTKPLAASEIARRHRVAAELRANLMKRKALARAKAGQASSGPEDGADFGNPGPATRDRPKSGS